MPNNGDFPTQTNVRAFVIGQLTSALENRRLIRTLLDELLNVHPNNPRDAARIFLEIQLGATPPNVDPEIEVIENYMRLR